MLRAAPLAAGDAPCTIDDAQARIVALAPAPRQETVSLADALGRVTAQPIHASRAQPPFHSAAMDGWAVAGSYGGLYRIVGESRAGGAFDRALVAGEAIAISTGAPVPEGALRVVRREHATARGRLVEVAAGNLLTDVRQRGSDFGAGRLLVPQGTAIDIVTVALLAAAGVGTVRVGRLPTLAILATGDEIARSGVPPRPDQIHDAISLPLRLRARGAGAIVSPVAPAADDPQALGAAVDAALRHHIIVLIGGASGGRHDHARTVLRARGMAMTVASVLMKPGKPFWCGRLVDGQVVVGLPGNPVAALAAAELFLVPLIRAAQGAVTTMPALKVRKGGLGGASGMPERIAFGRFGDAGEALLLGGSDSAALLPVAGAELLLRANGTAVRL